MQNEMTAAEQKPLFIPLKTKWFDCELGRKAQAALAAFVEACR